MPNAHFTVAVARHAMATRFEIILHGANETSLRAAGEEALNEISLLEDRFSLYRPTSEIAHLNARAHLEPVRVSPELFRLLQHAQQLHRATGGAFDITIGPLMRCWGFMGGSGATPDPVALAEARAKIGMDLVQLNEGDFTVRFARPGVMIDLGAIGKGYAIERGAELLRDAGVTSAILHGGTSTVSAIGHPPDAEAWKVALELPPTNPADSPALLAVVPLRDESLSVSAVWGKSFQSGSKTFGHVLDPRTGEPTDRAVLAAVVTRDATEGDALATALLTDGPDAVERIAALRSGARALAVQRQGDVPRIIARGIALI